MNYYRDITFAAPTATLTSFPVLVRIQNDKMKARVTSSQGFDVAFQQNGTDLPFDLDYYDSSTGSGAWWVQIPSLPTGTATTIRMVYGDSTITTNQSTPSSVWTSYSVIHHFNSTTNWTSAVGNYTITFGGNSFADISLVSNPFTGRGMRFLITTGYGDSSSTMGFADGFESRAATISMLSSTDVIGAGDRACFFRTGWTNYGFYMDGNQFSTYAGGLTSTLTRQESGGILCYGGSTNGSEIGWVMNGVTQGTTSGDAYSIRYDSPFMAFYGYSVALPTELIIDELRISYNQYHSSAWLSYEQNQAIHHTDYTTYGTEFHADGTPVGDFFPWTRQTIRLD